MASAPDTDEKVTPDDIRAKLRELKGSVDTTAQKAAPIGIAIGAAAVLGLVVVAYALGRRAGLKRRTVVEIRRI